MPFYVVSKMKNGTSVSNRIVDKRPNSLDLDEHLMYVCGEHSWDMNGVLPRLIYSAAESLELYSWGE